LGGWPSLGEKGHQGEGRLQSLHMRMHADVPHAQTHIHTHVWDMYTYVYTHVHIHTYARTQHTHTNTSTHVRARTHTCARAHTRVHTHVGAAHRARRTSHRLALRLLIMCAPLALIALGFDNWGFSYLGLVTVQYGKPYINRIWGNFDLFSIKCMGVIL
jgi:hypothetical protein